MDSDDWAKEPEKQGLIIETTATIKEPKNHVKHLLSKATTLTVPTYKFNKQVLKKGRLVI